MTICFNSCASARASRLKWPVAAPAITRVADDSEEPRTPISADKCSEVSKGSERRLLHHIFRIVFIAHQPARQPIGGIEMRNDDRVKALSNCKGR